MREHSADSDKSKKEKIEEALSLFLHEEFRTRFIVEDKKYHRFIIIRDDEQPIFYIYDPTTGIIQSRKMHFKRDDWLERMAIAGEYIGIHGNGTKIELYSRKDIQYLRTLDYIALWNLTGYKNQFILINEKDQKAREGDEEDESLGKVLFYNPDLDTIEDSILIPDKFEEYSLSVMNVDLSRDILNIGLYYCGKDITIEDFRVLEYDLIKRRIIKEIDMGSLSDGEYAFPDKIFSFD